MRFVPILAATVVALGLSFASSGPSAAAPFTPAKQAETQSPVQSVQYYRWRERRYWGPRWRGGYCGRWRRICADRWGWGGPRFRGCVIRHGC
ncbi:glycosyl hydrolase family 5 [Hyphomicrobium methylovorum]|nr:glycosyl hydrolase family 5 [Hyphomicrobium methylovorum]